MKRTTHISKQHRDERGFTLVELLVSLLILAVAMGGISIILIMSMETGNKATNDTTSTMIAEHIMEQINSEPANSANPVFITDCGGVSHTVNTAGGPLGTVPNGGAGANLTATTAISPSVIDWTQAYTAVPAGYRMRYRSCGAGVGTTGAGTAYELRWNIITLTPYTRLVVISARPVQDTNSTISTGLRFVNPPNLRTIGGMN